jgi:hypothetical protein
VFTSTRCLTQSLAQKNNVGACKAIDDECQDKEDGPWCFDLARLTTCKDGKNIGVEMCLQGCNSVYEAEGRCRDAKGAEACPSVWCACVSAKILQSNNFMLHKGSTNCPCKTDGSCKEGLESLKNGGTCTCVEPYFQFEQASVNYTLFF